MNITSNKIPGVEILATEHALGKAPAFVACVIRGPAFVTRGLGLVTRAWPCYWWTWLCHSWTL